MSEIKNLVDDGVASRNGVLAFPKRQSPDEQTTIKVKSPSYSETCRHLHTVVDGNKRTLTCSDCQTVLDSIQWLVEWANRSRVNEYDRRHAEEVAAKLTVHAAGGPTGRALCGAGTNMKSHWTITITNYRFNVTCKKCKKLSGGGEADRERRRLQGGDATSMS